MSAAGLRKASGLTQIELAKALDVTQANIAFCKRSDKPPRSDLLSKMAKAFGVKLEDLLLSSERPIAKRKGPVGEVQRTFEAVTELPRKQQRKVLEMVQALVEQYKAQGQLKARILRDMRVANCRQPARDSARISPSRRRLIVPHSLSYFNFLRRDLNRSRDVAAGYDVRT